MPKLKGYSTKHRQALEKKWLSIPYKQIANDLGVSLDTVKSWFRAKGFLKEAYSQYAEDQILIRKLQEKQEMINTLNGNNQQ